MIKFDTKNKIFTLSNDKFAYIFYVNPVDVLVKLYYGKPINDLTENNLNAVNNLAGDVFAYLDLEKNEEHEFYDPHFTGQYNAQEIPTFACFDRRPSLVNILHDDGSRVTDFRYVSHEIIKGKPTFENMPYIRMQDSKCETLVVTLKDRKADIILKAYYTVFEDLPIVIRHNEIKNNGVSRVILEKAASLALDLPSNDYKVLSVHGTYASDRLLETVEVKHNTVSIDENAGGKGFYHNPVGMLIKDGTTADAGEAIGFGMVYTGNFDFSFTGTQMDQIRMVLGINEESFAWNLDSGESFVTPEAFLIYSGCGKDEVTHTFHDLIRDHILPKKLNIKENTILLNSWEGTYFNFDTEKILGYLDRAKGMGVDLFVLDDGWFGKRNTDYCSLGDWEVNKEKIDLEKVINHAHELGIRFGLWIEPEMVSYDSNLYREHPEYALFDREIDPVLGRHQLVLDLTNPEVVDAIYSKIHAIFSKYKLDYCKWDYNRTIAEPVSSYLPKERQGEVFHRHILGTYEILRRFNKDFPNVLLETCAGGGGRFDIGMLFYCSQIWASDESDAVSRTFIQYATNMFYPACVIGAHVSARKYLSIKEKAAVAMFGTFGYELNPLKLTEEQIEEMKSANAMFVENKETVYCGNYYPLINPFENNNFVSWQYSAKDGSSAVVFVMNYHLINWRSRFLKLKGLDPNKTYTNSLDGKAYKGDFYMNVGLNICSGRDNFTPQIIRLNETK